MPGGSLSYGARQTTWQAVCKLENRDAGRVAQISSQSLTTREANDTILRTKVQKSRRGCSCKSQDWKAGERVVLSESRSFCRDKIPQYQQLEGRCLFRLTVSVHNWLQGCRACGRPWLRRAARLMETSKHGEKGGCRREMNPLGHSLFWSTSSNWSCPLPAYLAVKFPNPITFLMFSTGPH